MEVEELGVATTLGLFIPHPIGEFGERQASDAFRHEVS